MDLNESDESSVPYRTLATEELLWISIAVIGVKFTNFYRTFLFSWLDLFARLIVERMASFARPTSASLLIDV